MALPENIPENESELMQSVPNSNWYNFSLECGHTVYSRIRLRYEKPGRQRHRIRCPECQKRNEGTNEPVPLTWSLVINVRAATDAEVRDVLSGLAFIVPRRILRFDITGAPNGNPFPYASIEHEY